jgi:hypothetical protein
MTIDFLLDSSKCAMYYPVVSFVVVVDFTDERNQHSEATTDKSHDDFSIHVTTGLVREYNLLAVV